MKIKKTYLKSTALSLAALGFSLCPCLSAYAQSTVISERNAIIAEELSQLIKNDNLLTEDYQSLDEFLPDNLSETDILRHLRQHAYGRITLGNKLDPQILLARYKSAIEASGNSRDKAVFQMHQSLLAQIDISKPGKKVEERLAELSKATKDEDWYVANNAWLLMSVLNSSLNNPYLALQQTQEAYAVIPNDISPYVTDARILTLNQTAYLNNVALNPELAIENTAELIRQKRAAGYPIDGSSLLNNLLYSLSKWREHDVSTSLAQTVLDIEKKVGSNTPGLTELRVAQLYDRQGQFEASLNYSRMGIKNTQIASIRETLQFLEINALIGLGDVSEAKQKLADLHLKESNSSRDAFRINLARAELGMAIANKDEVQIYERLNTLLNLTTQNHLRAYSTNTSDLIANLENTKERQAEREDSLKREAEQKTRTNQLLMVLVGLLSLAALFAVMFARYRDKISKELAIKTAEAEDADRMKSEFLGMVSHELRTPLNGIVGIADLLAMQAPSDDLRHKAGIILDSSNKLTHVIESIVDMSTIDGDKMELHSEVTDIHEVVMDLDQLWRPTLENKGVIFTSFIENSLSDEVVLDKFRFRQCLNNLLSNAAKFTESGRVHLHVTSKLISETNLTEITAIIADTGQGMSEAVQEKLFTPFLQADSTMTRKHGGSGLGLAITRSLARMMGGDVTMVSALGRGSEFVLTVRGEKSEAAQILDDVEALMDKFDMMQSSTPTDLQHDVAIETLDPVKAPVLTPVLSSANPSTETDIFAANPQEQTQPAPLRSESIDDLRGLKVLIVEDNVANQDVIKLFLTPEGCHIQCVMNGREALGVLGTQAVDVILMDIRMPGMDGIEATHAIRNSGQAYKNTPIIALTADASAETNAACMAAGADIFLTKPVMARNLIESIRFVRRFQDSSEFAAFDVA